MTTRRDGDHFGTTDPSLCDGRVPSVPPDHPFRHELHDEIHKRPFVAVAAPQDISHLSVLYGDGGEAADQAAVRSLCRLFEIEAQLDMGHFIHDFGPFRLKWERHTEFSTYTFLRSRTRAGMFAIPALRYVPEEWLSRLPGHCITAIHVAVEPLEGGPKEHEEVFALFGTDNVAGSSIAGGAAMAWTDFRIHEDGFGRMLIQDLGLGPLEFGRFLQRLLEIETYRMMALLAFPLARHTMSRVTRIDRSLAEISEAMSTTEGLEDDRSLLNRLTDIAAQMEALTASTSFRFSAARAYNTLVSHRIAELHEQPVAGLQTIHEFMDRRLAPAMRTCEAAHDLQDALSGRIARAGNLLRTRVDVGLEEQNRNLLRSMDRRAHMQARLQNTIELFSVAAITYYTVSLIKYILDALDGGPLGENAKTLTALSVPMVAVAVWLLLRFARQMVERRTGGVRS